MEGPTKYSSLGERSFTASLIPPNLLNPASYIDRLATGLSVAAWVSIKADRSPRGVYQQQIRL